MEFYLVRIFPYSDWIRTRKNSYLDTFQAVKDTNIQITQKESWGSSRYESI